MPDTNHRDSREKRMAAVLESALSPEFLQVVNCSHLHQGHAGAPQAGEQGYMESHFEVRICATRFVELSRIERQRLVYDLLKPEFENGLHALSLELSTPEQKQS